MDIVERLEENENENPQQKEGALTCFINNLSFSFKLFWETYVKICHYVSYSSQSKGMQNSALHG